MLSHRLGELAESLAEYGTWSGDIQPHEAVPLFPSEHLSVVQCQMCFVDEKVEKLLVGEPQAAAVEPYQERCLRSPWPYAGDILSAVVLHEAYVVLHVRQHLAPPGLPMLEGGYGGDGRKERSLVHFVCLQPVVEPRAYLLVWYDGVAADETGYVESLRRSLECYAVLACSLAD